MTTDRVDNLGNEKEIRVDGMTVKSFNADEAIKIEKYERKKDVLKNGKLPFLMLGIRKPGGPGI